MPVQCPGCRSAIAEGSRFCSACGTPLVPSSALPTEHLPSARPQAETRFVPGTVLAGRYRIVGLLGRGGMGEVYRADDMKLGQPVALKFLPAGFEGSRERLQALLDEVSVARRISHPNVCRIYDIGEAEGLHFLSMEYVDGEDLGSLLRRIGYLPKDKAIQVARQICAGLAASHELGVLHRDLKPANVMIDGRGRARITDFGLAGSVEKLDPGSLAGTPAYMAPEQLEGKEVSVRSDIYALGLVLYELFTGSKAFTADSLPERRRQSGSAPSTPSSLVEGFDPAVERVIFRCLEEDPARRPSSALAVAAGLPGGDPLAEALAAGETPAPELVAEAGSASALSPSVAWGLLGLFGAALLACLALSSRTSLLGLVRLEKPPVVLEDRARQILALAGQDRPPADSLHAFEANRPYLEELQRRVSRGETTWDVLGASPPPGILFWYRQSPAPLVPVHGAALGEWITDPPATVPGMAHVALDPEGRLVALRIVPGERFDLAASSLEPDWDALVHATGVDPATLSPADPEWAPSVFADRRRAWTASWPGGTETVRIEAASAGGAPVSLRVLAPWSRPAEEPPPPAGFWRRAGQLMNTVGFISVGVIVGIVALRNVRNGRGDRRGALRFALYMGAVRMLWYVGAHHVASPRELEILVGHLSYAMQRVGLAYVFYLAVEPYARRLWPHMLVSWIRVLDGRFSDPQVGRDLLVGSAAAAVIQVIIQLSHWVPQALGGAPLLPTAAEWRLEALRGPAATLIAAVSVHTLRLLEIIFPITFLIVFRLLFRRTLPAVLAVSLIGLVISFPDSGSIPAYLLAIGLSFTILWSVLFRFGLLALAVVVNVSGLIEDLPLTPHPPSWHMGAMLIALAVIAAPALWGFWAARGRRL